ncbi:MAG: ABC transporter permease [Bdellovibrio sp.]|nr:ABC transporter permease [Bdellovibrio sp.]
MLFLAFRHIFARKRQSLLTLLGVALGTGTFVAFAAIMTGFQDYIIDQLVNNDAHVRISAKETFLSSATFTPQVFPSAQHVFWITPPSGQKESSKITYPLSWYSRLEKDSRVLAFAPQLSSSVIFSKSGISKGGALRGVTPLSQVRVTNIEKYMLQGRFQDLAAAGNRVLVGEGLLNKMGARMGDNLLISDGRNAPIPFKIIGVFKLGIVNVDDSTAFAHIRDVQQAIRRPSEISDIAIRLTDVEDAQVFAAQYAALAKEKVLSWDQANESILSVFSIQDFTRSFISIAIMVVAAFGIYNILNIVVNQKRKDIGILRSMGFDGNDIVTLFLLQGVVLGSCGGTLGLIMGFTVSKYVGTLKIGGMMGGMVINYSPSIYITGFLVALGASIISSYLPARSAGKLRPIDIVRGGE